MILGGVMKKILFLLLFASLSFAQNLYINEFMALNNSTIKDNFDRYEDWIEIYNAGNLPVDLTGFGLTDEKTQPYKWVFTGDVEIPPKGYLLIWASNRDTIIGDFIHTNFALNGSGEFIGLSSPTQIFIDSITFGPQTADRSFGRKPDGSSNWMIFISPTPGYSNDSLSTLPLPSPTFSYSSGIYSSPFTLTLSHPISNAQIYYTLDGSHPSTNSILYTSPILIDSNRVVRAIAYLPNRPQSKIATRSYFISPAGNLPILSIVTDPQNLYSPDSGIYIHYDSTGDNWERFSTVEFFERNGVDKFSIDCGLRIHGGFTRAKAKKSFRANFRRIYGNSVLNYKLFKDFNADVFDEVVFKAGSNDMSRLSPRWTLIRDQLISNLWMRYKGLISHGFYAIVYLNGSPFGIYNIREHIDSIYLKQHLGIKYPELRENWTQKLGSSANWDSIWSFIYNQPQLDSVQFKFVEDRVDIKNYIDYFAFQIYCGNFDWPHNNLLFGRDALGGKWNWIMWDVDQTFAVYDFGPYNTIEWALRDTVRTDLLYYDYPDLVEATRFPRRLFSNTKFRESFISRFTDLLNTAFQPQNVLPIYDSLKNHLNSDITFEIQKWGSSYQTWLKNLDTLRMFIETRVDSLRLYTIRKFGFTGLNNVMVNLNPSNGKLYINDLEINSTNFSGKYFTGMKITVSAEPAIGFKFSHWSDTTLPKSKSFTTTVNRDFVFEPIFVPDTSPVNIAANNVIINEYWLNDNGTRYASIGHRPIYGDWVELLVTKDGGVDLRNWRLTNNSTKTKRDTTDLNEGSIFFKNLPQLSSVPKGTYILLVLKKHPSNDYYFSSDDLDYSDSTMIFYIGNGNLDGSFDPGFGVRTSNDRLVLLHPNKMIDYSDDIGVDFISEGSDVTPSSFGVSNDGVNFINPFVGIGDDDGAIFAYSALNNFNNDNGIDENPGDDKPGSGGWIVDPSKEFTGDDPANPNQRNILTPGKKNYSGTTDVVDIQIPEKFILYNNYPNPFNSQTKIKFALPVTEKVEIKVYNILGQEIATLLNDIKQPAYYEIIFDASKYNLASGVYIVNLRSGKFNQSIKMLYLK
jgi:hypothetical protein